MPGFVIRGSLQLSRGVLERPQRILHMGLSALCLRSGGKARLLQPTRMFPRGGTTRKTHDSIVP